MPRSRGSPPSGRTSWTSAMFAAAALVCSTTGPPSFWVPNQVGVAVSRSAR